MTENEYKKLMIETIRVGDYKEKESLLELLRLVTIRFEKTGTFTGHLWDHRKEYIPDDGARCPVDIRFCTGRSEAERAGRLL